MRTLLLAAVVSFLAVPAASAQGAFMPYLGYNLESENALVGVGARFAFPLQVPISLTAQPAIEYQFAGEGITFLQIDLNGVVQFDAGTSVAPYAGAGLAIGILNTDVVDDTDLAFNVLGGAIFNPTGFGQPFAQVRYTTDGDGAFTVMGGVALGL